MQSSIAQVYNSQWFSDVIGGALLGLTTAKGLLWLHQRQALEPGSWRIFALSAPASSTNSRASNISGVGLGVFYS
jgi:hypothetical protein